MGDVIAAGVPPPAAVAGPETRARAPEMVALGNGPEALVEVRYAAPSGGRAFIQRRDAGGRPCVLLIGDWTRGGMLVDRDASRRFRLIGRDEKPYDLTWEGGRLTLRHAGRVIRRSRPVNAACPELPSAPDSLERP